MALAMTYANWPVSDQTSLDPSHSGPVAGNSRNQVSLRLLLMVQHVHVCIRYIRATANKLVLWPAIKPRNIILGCFIILFCYQLHYCVRKNLCETLVRKAYWQKEVNLASFCDNKHPLAAANKYPLISSLCGLKVIVFASLKELLVLVWEGLVFVVLRNSFTNYILKWSDRECLAQYI